MRDGGSSMGLTDDQGDRILTGASTHGASDVGIEVRHGRDSIQDQLVTMKKEIDALQIGLGESNRPWYKQASTVIAVVALLLSFGTTYYSNRQARLQDTHNAKIELRGLIEEIESASLATVDVQNKYKDNPQALGLAGSLVRTRQLVLVTQAAAVIDSIPDEVTATEYYAVASALSQFAGAQRVLPYYERGLARADNIDSYTAITRSIGQTYFGAGNYERGRSAFTQALSALERFHLSGSYGRSYNAYTHITWASAELASKHCLEARKHHEEARRLLQQLASEGGNYNIYVVQLKAQEQLLQKQCQ
jgi:tetratricopeptide (TPR) repeat protein